MIHSPGVGWGIWMRGSDERSGSLFSYVDLESRVRGDHPLRPIREIADAALQDLSADFAALYPPRLGRPSIPPERLLRAMLLQAFYGIRSERQLMERMEFDLLFRWFAGLGVDDPAWDHSSFTKAWRTKPCPICGTGNSETKSSKKIKIDQITKSSSTTLSIPARIIISSPAGTVP